MGRIYHGIKVDYKLLQSDELLKDIDNMGIHLLHEITQCESKIDDDYSHNNFFISSRFRNVIERISTKFITALVGEILAQKQEFPLTNIRIHAEKLTQPIRNHYTDHLNNF